MKKVMKKPNTWNAYQMSQLNKNDNIYYYICVVYTYYKYIYSYIVYSYTHTIMANLI